jgi:hypothetical protein
MYIIMLQKQFESPKPTKPASQPASYPIKHTCHSYNIATPPPPPSTTITT